MQIIPGGALFVFTLNPKPFLPSGCRFQIKPLPYSPRAMQNIVIDKPYVPVLPHRGRVWPGILSILVPRILRKKYGVEQIDFVNEKRLRDSLDAGHGILIAPNHCRDEDPFIIGMLSRRVGKPFYAMASWHVFMQDRKQAFYFGGQARSAFIAKESIARPSIPPST